MGELHKSYKRWKTLPNFSKYIFGHIDKCLPSSKKSQTYLKKLGVSNIRFMGNIKFSQSENKIFKIQNKLKNLLIPEKHGVEYTLFRGKVLRFDHKKLKKKLKTY